jgi:mevalonate kinase
MIFRAPAKIILFGEHAVVYNQPAIAAPVSSLNAQAVICPSSGDEGLFIDAKDLNMLFPVSLDADMVDNALTLTAQKVLSVLNINPPNAIIQLTSNIPMASGLGSGAAVSTAVARAIIHASGAEISQAQLNAIIFEVEKLYHGTPSGVDNTVIVYETPVYFIRNHPIQRLKLNTPITFLIGDTGKASLTKVAVGDVRTLYDRDPVRVQMIFEKIGDIARNAHTALQVGDIINLGYLMDENHTYLQQLTVSSPELDHLVNTAREAGALGAKLSGGGRGGNMIALTTPERAKTIQKALLDAGAIHVYQTEIAP